ALAASKIDARLLRTEALQFNPDLIAANRQQVHNVVSRCAADRCADFVSAEVVDGDGRARQNGTAVIGDAADNVTGGDLRGCSGNEQTHECDGDRETVQGAHKE